MASTTERENHIYMAKLAEQAERYDGLFLTHSLSKLSHYDYTLFGFWGKKKKKPELLNSRFFKLIIFHFENECRYGGTDEEKGDQESRSRHGTERGREEPVLRCVQEHGGSSQSLMEDLIFARAEGRIERERSDPEADQGV